jgi:acyl carrier protein
MSIQDQLRVFIADETHVESPATLTDDYPLIERGVVDSMGILNIVSFIEREYGIEVQDEELVQGNFGTISSMARLIDAKRGA